MNDIKQASRSETMKREFDIQDLPKSGFNLTYNSHVGGLVLGRIYPMAYQYIMPGDKYSGRNDYELTAEKLVTPVVSDVRVSTQNFFVTFRSIDKGFPELQTPTKLNGMSASISTPQFSLYNVIKEIVIELHNFMPDDTKPSDSVYIDNASELIKDFANPVQFGWDFSNVKAIFDYTQPNSPTYWKNLIRNSAIGLAMKNSYCDDSLEDLFARIQPYEYDIFNSNFANDWEEFQLYLRVYEAIFDFFCGEGSLMDYFGLPILSHIDLAVWLIYMGNLRHGSQIDWLQPDASPSDDLLSDTIHELDKRLVWEYPLRAYYAIWFEHVRNMWLEPRSVSLPEYHDWGSTPLISGSSIALGIATLLVTRVMPWGDDPFNTSQIDDISRHVYAPIIQANNTSGDLRQTFANPAVPAQSDAVISASSLRNTAVGNLWSSVDIKYVDANGLSNVLSCPLPDALSSLDVNYVRSSVVSSVTSGSILDLFTLKKAKMYERFLKRNFAFGDEYRDRLKAQYGVTIEDYRINRPHNLGGAVDSVNIEQQIANTGAPAGTSGSGIVEQGSRVAYGGVKQEKNTDGFTFFATEFGIYISLQTIYPLAQYNHTDPVAFTQKMQDFPIPVFAMQQEDINNSSEMYRLGFMNRNVDNKPFGHVPYAHGWRYRIDEVHGQMLSSKYDYTFARFYKGLTNDGVPKLNYWFLHCRPNIPMFVNQILLDGQFYGTTKHSFLVERLLPQPVESI